MKKSTRILFALVAVMMLVSACGQPAAPTAPTAPAAPEAPAAAAPAAEPAAPAEPTLSGSTVTLKIGYSTNEEDPRGLASKKFKEIVEQASGGSIIVEIYPSGQLGGDAALIEAMALDSGMVDIIITDASNFATYDAKMGVSALPFLFKDFETAWKFMDSDLVAGVEEALIEQNMRVLAHFCNGFRCVTTSKSEVLSPADMKGMLIRMSSAICEVAAHYHPCRVIRLGLRDVYARSGIAADLLDAYGLSVQDIVAGAKRAMGVVE